MGQDSIPLDDFQLFPIGSHNLSLDGPLYGVSPVDPLTYAVAFAAIRAAALLGSWRPAAKAARANPVDAIRAE